MNFPCHAGLRSGKVRVQFIEQGQAACRIASLRGGSELHAQIVSPGTGGWSGLVASQASKPAKSPRA